MVRIILFEDNKNYREALVDAFTQSDHISLAGAFPNAEHAVRKVREYKPDVVLMDIEMPVISGLDALKQIKGSYPETPVMILTDYQDDHRIFVALCRGANGYAAKSISLTGIESAINAVHLGGGFFTPSVAAKVIGLFQDEQVQQEPEFIDLTKRELEVLKHLQAGLMYKEIASQLYISYEGVHSHIKNIYKKLHVNSRSKAVIKAVENRLL